MEILTKSTLFRSLRRLCRIIAENSPVRFVVLTVSYPSTDSQILKR